MDEDALRKVIQSKYEALGWHEWGVSLKHDDFHGEWNYMLLPK